MKLVTTFSAAVAFPLLLVAQEPVASPAASSVAGDWIVYFQAMGRSVPGKLHLDVHGEAVSGTIETTHTGPGKLQDGKFADNKLTATLVFERHESIIFEGERKSDGTFAGQYKTEGRTDTWHAERPSDR